MFLILRYAILNPKHVKKTRMQQVLERIICALLGLKLQLLTLCPGFSIRFFIGRIIDFRETFTTKHSK